MDAAPLIAVVAGAVLLAACASGPSLGSTATSSPTGSTTAPSTSTITPANPSGATTIELELVDRSRPTAATAGVAAADSRTLPTTVYLPASGGPAPLIVLAHGAGGAPDRFTQLASAWADHGYLVAAPRFPLTNDGVPNPVLGDFPEQGRDVRFVIDELLARSASGIGDLAGRIDAERIGLYGLSLGSLTVWSELFDPTFDPRIDAVVQSDGTQLIPDGRIGELTIPVLVAHSDVDGVFAYADVLAGYDRLPGPKYLLTMHGALHAAVGEDTATPADETYRQVTVAFWDRALGGRPDAPFPADVPGVTSFVDGDRGAALPGTR